ncbi:transposase (plasmid) [Rhizobium sp. YTUHZ045]|uniref:transposase n=1 Tax=Rhizobium TaxID=379 RepID=UPI0039F6B5EA
MADEEILEQAEPLTETETAPPPKKRTSSAKGKRLSAGAKASKAEPAAISVRQRRYSDSERAEKLAQIEARASAGDTLKAAIKDAGISEQTYYQWKRTDGAVEAPAAKPQPDARVEPSAGVDTLADLVALEEENKRLRQQLAEKLRAENAELRKRLGLD